MQYNQEELRIIQLAQLKILKKIDEVCQKNNINYALTAGTAIGAVRHGGFIPWDDDIDVVMLQKDYDRFLEIGQKELGEDYFLQTPQTDKNYITYFAKVRANNTEFREDYLKKVDMHHGIYVDIFPMYNLPSDKEERIKHLNTCNKYYKIYRMKKSPDTNQMNVNRFKYIVKSLTKKFVAYVVFAPLTINFLQKKLDNLYHKYDDLKNVDYVGWNTEDYSVPFSWVEPYKKMKFENEEFYCFKETEKYLELAYGDYMTLPPVEKRVNHKPSFVDYEAAKRFLEKK